MNSQGWKTLKSKVVYQNRYIVVKEDAVIKPDGAKGIYGHVSIPRTVGIVAVDKKLNVYLCKQ